MSKVNSVAAEFRKVSDIQMAETTKRAIRENVSVNQQLSKMSEKTMDFVHQNEHLRQTEKDLLRKVNILEFSNQELTRKNVSIQKVLRLMRDKVGEREAWNSELEQKAIRCTMIEQDIRLAQEDTMANGRENMVSQTLSQYSECNLPPDRETRTNCHRLTAPCLSSIIMVMKL